MKLKQASTHMLWIKCNDTVVTLIINYNSKNAALDQDVLTDNLIAYLQQSDTLKQCKKSDFIERQNLFAEENKTALTVFSLMPKKEIDQSLLV